MESVAIAVGIDHCPQREVVSVGEVFLVGWGEGLAVHHGIGPCGLALVVVYLGNDLVAVVVHHRAHVLTKCGGAGVVGNQHRIGESIHVILEVLGVEITAMHALCGGSPGNCGLIAVVDGERGTRRCSRVVFAGIGLDECAGAASCIVHGPCCDGVATASREGVVK